MLKTMVVYTLEIAPSHAHPRNLSTLSLCIACRFLVFPRSCRLARRPHRFAGVFACGAVLIALAGLLTFRLIEPRHDTPR